MAHEANAMAHEAHDRKATGASVVFLAPSTALIKGFVKFTKSVSIFVSVREVVNKL